MRSRIQGSSSQIVWNNVNTIEVIKPDAKREVHANEDGGDMRRERTRQIQYSTRIPRSYSYSYYIHLHE